MKLISNYDPININILYIFNWLKSKNNEDIIYDIALIGIGVILGGLITWFVSYLLYRKAIKDSNKQFENLSNHTEKHFDLITEKTDEIISSQRQQYNEIIRSREKQMEILFPIYARTAEEATYEAESSEDEDQQLRLEQDGLYYNEVVDKETYDRYFSSSLLTEKCPRCNSKSFELNTKGTSKMIVCKNCKQEITEYKDKKREELKKRMKKTKDE